MKDKIMNAIFICWIAGMAGLFLLLPKERLSYAERRKLSAMPALTIEKIKDTSFMSQTEVYLLDHFPFREAFRRLKAYFAYDVLQQKENNGIYVAGGYAGKLEYPLREDSVKRAADKMMQIQQMYLQDNEVYYAVIPDKNYYLAAQNGYPSIDYEKMLSILQSNITGMHYIDIWDTLSIEDYYKTDTHWRQECLEDTVLRIGEEMDFARYLPDTYEQEKIPDFYGVYYGQSALPLSAESLSYLTNDTVLAAKQWNLETDQWKPVYELDKLEGTASMDKYDIFLGGASPIQKIVSPKAKTDKRLILFRDSFASSLAPLLLEAYQEITLIDTRYISSALLQDYVEFEGAQVLFMYNTLILNNSSMLK